MLPQLICACMSMCIHILFWLECILRSQEKKKYILIFLITLVFIISNVFHFFLSSWVINLVPSPFSMKGFLYYFSLSRSSRYTFFQFVIIFLIKKTILLSFLKDNFAKYRILGWNLVLYFVYITLLPCCSIIFYSLLCLMKDQ